MMGIPKGMPIVVTIDLLALYASRSITLAKCFNFAQAGEVEITLDAVLQAGSGNCKVNAVLFILKMGQSIDDACGKGISTTDTIDYIRDLIMT